MLRAPVPSRRTSRLKRPAHRMRRCRSISARRPREKLRASRDKPERTGSRAGDGKRHTHRNSRLLLFVAQRFSKAELAPLSDPIAPAQLQEFNSYLCSTVHVAHAHGRRGARWADDAVAIDAMKRKVLTTMTECFELIERKLLKGRGSWASSTRPATRTVHDRDLDRRRRGRHDQAATRHGEPQTHADAPGGAKSRGDRRDPNLLD